MPPTVYQASLRRTVLLALAALGFVAVSVWLLLSRRGIRMDIAGAAGLMFFGLAAAAPVYRLIRRREPDLDGNTGDTPTSATEVRWTDDLTIPLPPGRTVAELVDVVLGSALRAEPVRATDRLLAVEFGLSKDESALARDRCFGGLVRAATGNPLNCPPRDKDPVAWESFQRGVRDPSLATGIYPDLA